MIRAATLPMESTSCRTGDNWFRGGGKGDCRPTSSSRRRLGAEKTRNACLQRVVLATPGKSLYNVTMKTLSITEGRQNLGAWLKRALRGEDVGFLVDGRVVALRPVTVHSEDYALHEYGVDAKRAERAYQAVKADIKAARSTRRLSTGRAARRTKPFTGKL